MTGSVRNVNIPFSLKLSVKEDGSICDMLLKWQIYRKPIEIICMSIWDIVLLILPKNFRKLGNSSNSYLTLLIYFNLCILSCYLCGFSWISFPISDPNIKNEYSLWGTENFSKHNWTLSAVNRNNVRLVSFRQCIIAGFGKQLPCNFSEIS